MCESPKRGMKHSASVPLLQDKTIELKHFTVNTVDDGSRDLEREAYLHRLNDIAHTPRTTKRLAGLFGKSTKELHSEYAFVSLHQVRKYC